MGKMDSAIDGDRITRTTDPRDRIRWIAKQAGMSDEELLDFLLGYLVPRSDDPCCGNVTDRIILTLVTKVANPNIGNTGRI